LTKERSPNDFPLSLRKRLKKVKTKKKEDKRRKKNGKVGRKRK
jgi:hypothetical protein